MRFAFWFSGPEAEDRWADPLWREIYHGYSIYMERNFGADSVPAYRDFAERVNRHEIACDDCLMEVGYIRRAPR